jgi:hypothetical protein
MNAFKRALFALVCVPLAQDAHPALLSLAQVPLFLTSKTLPNVLVIYDNSESMDGTMAGKLIAGDDPTTRGNIARTAVANHSRLHELKAHAGPSSALLRHIRPMFGKRLRRYRHRPMRSVVRVTQICSARPFIWPTPPSCISAYVLLNELRMGASSTVHRNQIATNG